MKNIKDLSFAGIYKIINTTNNKIYVGSAKNIKSRIKKHFSSLSLNKHDNQYLQKSYNKNGINIFKVEVLEIVNNLEDLISREQYWIDKLKVCDRNVGYNICPTAGNTLGKEISKNTREKISKSLKEYFKNNDNAFLGKKHDDNAKYLMSNKKQHLMKRIINLDTKEEFRNLREASEAYNVSPQAISMACNGINHTCCGFRWKHL